jgi:F-box interacting protein
MAEAARARAAPLHPGLPDEIFIWEILLRLPPKPLLRCRAVCRAWRRATSTRDFLLAHHRRQPSLPLLYECSSTDDGGGYLEIMPLDHRAGVAPADQLRSVARLGTGGAFTIIEASCDGLLILCTFEGVSCLSNVAYYSVCNPATREYAPLPQLRGFSIAGMYPHPPTGEYRLLLYPDALLAYDELEQPSDEYHCYVYALGSCERPRDIGSPHAEEADEAIHTVHAVLFRGGLHWFIEKDETHSSMIILFDTITELFRWMRAPAVPGIAQLFEMDGMLGMASFNDAMTTIDIWVTLDYDSEVWGFKYRVELPIAELTVRFGLNKYSKLVVSSWDDNGVLILAKCRGWLLQIDMGGKLVSSFHSELLGTTQFRLKQTLVPHAFFPTIEGYVVNTWPFISPYVIML